RLLRSPCRRLRFATNAHANCCAKWPAYIRRIPAQISGRRSEQSRPPGLPAGRIHMEKGRSKAAYMISAVAEQYEIHPQTLRLYEREGLLKPSRSEGNTRLYTEEDLERLEVILHL